jgi:hypothetical protein
VPLARSRGVIVDLGTDDCPASTVRYRLGVLSLPLHGGT